MNTKETIAIFKQSSTPLADDVISVAGFLKLINNQINASHKVTKDKTISFSLMKKIVKQLNEVLTKHVVLDTPTIRIGKLPVSLKVENNKYVLFNASAEVMTTKLGLVW